jgi:hypothetical protein
MRGIIYKYTSLSGKSYIGQTRQGLKKRADWSGKGYNQSTYFYNAIRKYGFKNFSTETLHAIDEESLDILLIRLNELECLEIQANNTIYPNGYNIQTGGNVGAVSLETREKIRQKLLGIKHTPERRLNQSLARLGKEPWNKGKKMDWSKERRELQANIGGKSLHNRWHTKRDIIKEGCIFCERA